MGKKFKEHLKYTSDNMASVNLDEGLIKKSILSPGSAQITPYLTFACNMDTDIGMDSLHLNLEKIWVSLHRSDRILPREFLSELSHTFTPRVHTGLSIIQIKCIGSYICRPGSKLKALQMQQLNSGPNQTSLNGNKPAVQPMSKHNYITQAMAIFIVAHCAYKENISH